MQNLDKRISALENTNNAAKLWAWRYYGETLEDVLKRIGAEGIVEYPLNKVVY
jgi:hypothetical protein